MALNAVLEQINKQNIFILNEKGSIHDESKLNWFGSLENLPKTIPFIRFKVKPGMYLVLKKTNVIFDTTCFL